MTFKIEAASDQTSLVNQSFSMEEVRIENTKANRQNYNITPASAEAEAGVFFSSLILYYSKYLQIIRSVLGQGTNKAINKVS